MSDDNKADKHDIVDIFVNRHLRQRTPSQSSDISVIARESEGSNTIDMRDLDLTSIAPDDSSQINETTAEDDLSFDDSFISNGSLHLRDLDNSVPNEVNQGLIVVGDDTNQDSVDATPHDSDANITSSSTDQTPVTDNENSITIGGKRTRRNKKRKRKSSSRKLVKKRKPKTATRKQKTKNKKRSYKRRRSRS